MGARGTSDWEYYEKAEREEQSSSGNGSNESDPHTDEYIKIVREEEEKRREAGRMVEIEQFLGYHLRYSAGPEYISSLDNLVNKYYSGKREWEKGINTLFGVAGAIGVSGLLMEGTMLGLNLGYRLISGDNLISQVNIENGPTVALGSAALTIFGAMGTPVCMFIDYSRFKYYQYKARNL